MQSGNYYPNTWGHQVVGAKFEESGTKHWNSPNTGANKKSDLLLCMVVTVLVHLHSRILENKAFGLQHPKMVLDFIITDIHNKMSKKYVPKGYVIMVAGFSVCCVKD